MLFCYDEDVWQQDAARAVKTGRYAVKNSRSFLKHVVPAVLKPARSLWNQMVGFLFLCLGTIFSFAAFRYLSQKDDFRFLVAIGCALIMIWFGLSSFWRARKISRS